jgi:hypothetical protein
MAGSGGRPAPLGGEARGERSQIRGVIAVAGVRTPLGVAVFVRVLVAHCDGNLLAEQRLQLVRDQLRPAGVADAALRMVGHSGGGGETNAFPTRAVGCRIGDKETRVPMGVDGVRRRPFMC